MEQRVRVAVAGLIAFVSVAGCKHRGSPAPGVEPTRHGPFAVHEWGLFAVDAAAADRAIAATETATRRHVGPCEDYDPGLGTLGAKPVIYVHLDEGTNYQRFSLRLGVPSSSLIERWPEGGDLSPTELPRFAGWRDVEARRGACALPVAPPTAESPTCMVVPDHFCEAAEIPRYTGSQASCLDIGPTRSELLFYRAGDLPTRHLPLRMVKHGEAWTIERTGTAPLAGPVFWLTTDGSVANAHIRRLGTNDFGRPLDSSVQGEVPPSVVREELMTEAVRRGLAHAEAEAFVDAWSPAFFDLGLRSGPEASGTVPAALQTSQRSLLYLAPEAVVDAMLPMTTDPPARVVHRVFLVRWVDGAALLPDEPIARGAPDHAFDDLHGHGPLPLAGILIPRAPVVSEGLSSDQVERVVGRNRIQIVLCYQMALMRNPSLDRARITVVSTIGAGGLRTPVTDDGFAPRAPVTDAVVEANSVGDPVFDTCVATVSRRWTYPAPSTERAVVSRVTYSLTRESPPPDER